MCSKIIVAVFLFIGAASAGNLLGGSQLVQTNIVKTVPVVQQIVRNVPVVQPVLTQRVVLNHGLGNGGLGLGNSGLIGNGGLIRNGGLYGNGGGLIGGGRLIGNSGLGGHGGLVNSW